jgi:diguanylate cyclase (GGDEF)-like protein
LIHSVNPVNSIEDLFGDLTLEEDLATDLLVLQSHLDGMIDQVAKNSASLRQYRDFEMRLLNLNSMSEIIEHILDDAKKYFDFEVISLCLVDEIGEIEKIVNEQGLDIKSSKGVIFLKDKDLLQSTFGFAIRPYIGTFQSALLSSFFTESENPVSVAITPLIRRQKYLGTLNLGSYKADRFAGPVMMEYIVHLSSVISICLENSLNFETIKRTSYIDTLTGVNNRRFFEQRINEELDRCQRNADPISCLFLDIDSFKAINDKYGHQGGDLVLSLAAKTIKTQLRNNDVLARYGGEEFVALLTNIDGDKAFEIAERIRKTVETLVIKYQDTSISITVSIGLSTHIPDKMSLTKADDAVIRLIKAADAALYKAKRNGRNRVEINKLSPYSELIDMTTVI